MEVLSGCFVALRSHRYHIACPENDYLSSSFLVFEVCAVIDGAIVCETIYNNQSVKVDRLPELSCRYNVDYAELGKQFMQGLRTPGVFGLFLELHFSILRCQLQEGKGVYTDEISKRNLPSLRNNQEERAGWTA